jgi:hypothetical protein
MTRGVVGHLAAATIQSERAVRVNALLARHASEPSEAQR